METRDGKLVALYSRQEIEQTVKRIADEIARDRDESQKLLLVCVLKGAFIFMADLVRALDFPVQIDFVRISTYADSQSPQKKPVISKDVDADIAGRNVIVVEDIVDTGFSIRHLLDTFSARKPKSLKLAALIDKRSRREVDVKIDYSGFTLEDGFIVGYGVDFAENYRHLPEIYVIKEVGR
jgi:hypoxanthine phosphoribosyltransferase